MRAPRRAVPTRAPLLQPVVERLELNRGPGSPLERGRDQTVGEPGVLRQKRAVQVGADHVLVPHSLVAVLAVVAVAVEHPSERCGVRAQVSPSAVVLEPREDPGAVAEIRLDRDVSDQPRARVADRLQVCDPQSRDRLVAQLVAVPEQLVAAAHREQRDALIDRRGDRIALGPHHVLGDQDLIAILAAPDVDQVVFRGVEALARTGSLKAEADPSPLAAPLQEDHVSSVRVDVHLLRIEREQPEFQGAIHPGTSSTTTSESASPSP